MQRIEIDKNALKLMLGNLWDSYLRYINTIKIVEFFWDKKYLYVSLTDSKIAQVSLGVEYKSNPILADFVSAIENNADYAIKKEFGMNYTQIEITNKELATRTFKQGIVLMVWNANHTEIICKSNTFEIAPNNRITKVFDAHCNTNRKKFIKLSTTSADEILRLYKTFTNVVVFQAIVYEDNTFTIQLADANTATPLTIDLECKTNIKLDYKQMLKEKPNFDSEGNLIVDISGIRKSNLCAMLELGCELRFEENYSNCNTIVSTDSIAMPYFL